jgi:UDP-N-acetylmuramyl pentapeptide phosphotransferase/UDP-N-acetylglucosamine-1-phosphate transferase
MVDLLHGGSNAALWAVIAFGVSIAVSAGLIVALRPWLARYAMARPNARSSHKAPTAQGGGIAVLAATIAGVVCYAGGAQAGLSLVGEATPIAVLCAAAILLAVVGAVDDIHVLEAIPRLIAQMVAVIGVIVVLPADWQIVPTLPLWLERALLVIGGIWFVNLVNFMDGIDWMTVAEIVPVTFGIALIGILGGLPPVAIIVAIALNGAMLGFAPFNRPVASLFLGDVGSLPIGLITGWLLLVVAQSGHWAAALLLPLYYLADATLTLLRRAIAREPVWLAHRSHFYQRATVNGFTVSGVVTRVFAVNLALVALAAATVLWPGIAISSAALVAGAALVGDLLARFSHQA